MLPIIRTDSHGSNSAVSACNGHPYKTLTSQSKTTRKRLSLEICDLFHNLKVSGINK